MTFMWLLCAIGCEGSQPAARDWVLQNTPAQQTPVERHGLLQAKGNRIVDKNGQPVSMAGPSLFWSQWMPQFYTREVVHFVHRDWNAPIIRAAIAVEHGGYLENPEEQLQRAFTVVDAALEVGMYVIVDWHDHRAEQHERQAIEFFTILSEKYGRHPNIIYEIYNEPLRVSWSNVIKPYAERVIAAIRKHDPDGLILVGTPNWSQDVEVAAQDPIRDVNVAYTLHFYAGTHRERYRAKAQQALDMGIPLFVSEWGTTNADGDGPIAHESVQEWLTFMRENHLSHLNWSIADKVEGSAMLRPGASPKGGWTDADLTASGLFVREMIRNWNRPQTTE